MPYLQMDFASILLLSTRVAAALLFTPVLGVVRIPVIVRVLLALTLGMSMAAALPGTELAGVTATSMDWLLAMLREVMIGAGFALGFLAAYAAMQMAGRILDVQIGFGAAGVLNPATATFSPLLGSVFGMLGLALFLALDGHHQLLRALALSVTFVQPHMGFEMAAVLQHTSALFVFALMLAAPIMLALLLVDVLMAVAARALPQLNILLLSFAFKVMLGTVLLAYTVTWVRDVYVRLFNTTFKFWAIQVGAP